MRDSLILLFAINRLEEKVMTKLSELEGEILSVAQQADKAHAEVIQRFNELEALLNDTVLPPGAETALQNLKVSVQRLDDLVPDAPPPPPPPPAQ